MPVLPLPTQPDPPSPPPYFPPPAHPAWLAFADGYLAGITHGIGMGRAQVAQEYADAETFPHDITRPGSYTATLWACEGLSRAEWLDRQRATRAEHAAHQYPTPAQSPEQMRENAFRSWGLIDTAHQDAA